MSKSATPIRKGRLRREATQIVSVRLPVSTYDLYCQRAFHLDQPVRALLRNVLTRHAPRRAY